MNDLMGKGSIQIDKDLLSKWEISEEELFFDAEKNTRNILGMELKDMHELLFGMLLQKWNPTDPGRGEAYRRRGVRAELRRYPCIL